MVVTTTTVRDSWFLTLVFYVHCVLLFRLTSVHYSDNDLQ